MTILFVSFTAHLAKNIEQETVYSSDPALWTIDNDLISYCILKGPTFCRNNSSNFENSIRFYNEANGKKKKRMLQKSLFYRKLKNGETIDREWLIYSTTKGVVFCFVCRLFSNERSQLSFFGFDDWKNDKRIKEHEEGLEHKDCLMVYSKRKSAVGRIDDALIQKLSAECTYWKDLLFRLVKVIKFIATRGLALRGSDQKLGSTKNGIYLGLIELISEFDPFLKNHLQLYGNKGSGTTSYLSANICEEIIEIMGKETFKYLIDELQKAKYYSISVDSTPDISHEDQLAFTVRYVNNEGPIERFLQYIPIESHKSEYLTDTVINFLEKNEINIHDCRGQSYDNAANMSGQYTGLQARLKEVNSYAEYVPCAGHSLNLVGVKAAECCLEVIQFFNLIQKLYTFFSSSTYKWKELVNALGKKKVLKALSVTRWSARSDAVTALNECLDDIISLLEKLFQDNAQTNDTRIEAKSHYEKLQEFTNIFLLIVWNDILSQIHNTNLTIQKESITLSVVVDLLESLEKFVNDKREKFYDYLNKAKSKADVDEIPRTHRLRKRSTNLTRFEGPAEDVIFDEENNLKIKIFYPIIDCLCLNIRVRKEAYCKINTNFHFFTNIHNMNNESIEESCKNISQLYSIIYPRTV